MPQLRDSSNSQPLPAQESDTSFERIFGIETEYGVSVTGISHDSAQISEHSGGLTDAAHVAARMFEPVMKTSHSSNTYTANGSRLYLDVGSHPEYATAEARTVRDAVLLDVAGERTMRELALAAQSSLRDELRDNALNVHVYKNNSDSRGHSFGCHENYLLRRSVSLSFLNRAFIPFLATRQIFAGAGTIRNGQFQISQRSDFLDDTISSATTRSRPMINTRDEAHADARIYRRLHVIVGDSNISQRATWMKMMTAHLVLCALECASRGCHDYEKEVGHQWPTLAHAGEDMKHVSRDCECNFFLSLTNGNTLTAVDIQKFYRTVAEKFLLFHGRDLARDIYDDAQECLKVWETTLNDISSGSVHALSSWVDWAAKHELLTQFKANGVSASRMAQVDLAYHDIAHRGVVDALHRSGRIMPLYTHDDISCAQSNAPQDTRAALRAQFIQAAQESPYEWSVDWTSVTVTDRNSRHCSAHLLNPFVYEQSREFRDVMAVLSKNQRIVNEPMLPLI
ncbi:proteasome accessory factor PafA2 family protein [Alloscardovia venturai]|uniref:Proteasome accessory factor PafA2 family protein n=1 Tax=Alloscardovia venturai TaxID=1769421 RepID=A0ABW2Y517_9BIFI